MNWGGLKHVGHWSKKSSDEQTNIQPPVRVFTPRTGKRKRFDKGGGGENMVGE